MKISIIIFLLLIFQFSNAKGQNDTAMYSVYYTFKHVRDTLKKDEIYSENMILYIGSYSSLYDSYDRITEDSLKKANLKLTKDAEGRTIMGISGNYKPKSVTMSSLFKFTNKGVIVLNQHYLGQQYLIEKPLPVINWEIKNDHKLINEIDCQKATCEFGGRVYEVWFTNSIPLSFGPWKLGGLPGLIFEAYDSKKEVQFLFNGFEKDKTKSVIILPQKGIITNEADFKAMYEETQSNPSSAIKIITGGGADLKPVNSSATNRGRAMFRKMINNPIELVKD